MRSVTLASAVLLSALSLVQAQTFTDCDPTKKSCPADPALGTTLTTDFTKFKEGENKDWEYADGTTMTYDPENGAVFSIGIKHEAPTVSSTKYIFFGKVSAYLKSSPGTGIVSSFILESDDLDEIDWEWLGSDDGNVQTNFFGKGDVSTYDRSTKVPVSTPIETWHTYTIDWTADRIVWLIDNNIVRTLKYDDPTAHQGTRYPQTPMKIKMGNWIGCLDASDPKTLGTCDWAGGQAVFSDDTSYQMFVKNITIEDYGKGCEYYYSDQSGTWQSIKSSGECNGGGDSPSSSSSAAPSSTSSSVRSTSSGGVFAQSSSTSSEPSSSTSESSSTKTSSSSAESTNTSATTLTTAITPKPSNTSGGNASPATTTSASGTTTPTAIPNDASSSKSKYGVIDFAVIALGLGLGYLVM